MRIRQLSNKDASIVQEFLRPQSRHCMFLRSNAARDGLELNERGFSGRYWGGFNKSGQLEVVVAQTRSGMFMPCTTDLNALEAVLLYCRDKLHGPLIGIVGAPDQVQLCYKLFGVSEDLLQSNYFETLFELQLDQLTPPAAVGEADYRLLPVAKVAKSLLFDWFRDYEIEALDKEPGEALDKHIHERVRISQEEGRRWILLKGQQPVSLAGFNAEVDEIVQIGPVWTPVEHRGQGYARVLLAKMLQQAQMEGVTSSILFTENPAAKKTYLSLGYKSCGNIRLSFLKQPTKVMAA